LAKRTRSFLGSLSQMRTVESQEPEHDVDNRAPSQQILVSSGLADVGAALPRGLIGHLIPTQADSPGKKDDRSAAST